MSEALAIGVAYTVWLLGVGFLIFLLLVLCLSAAYDMAREIDPQSQRLFHLSTAVACLSAGALILSLTTPELNIEIDARLFLAVWVLVGGYAVPRVGLVLFALFLPEFRTINSSDPLIEISELAPETVEPIRPWLEEVQAHARFTLPLHLGPIHFTIRLAPCRRIATSTLKGLLIHATELARVSEQASRQQAAEFEAQTARDLAKGHAEYLLSLSPEERGLLAAQLVAQQEASTQSCGRRNGDATT